MSGATLHRRLGGKQGDKKSKGRAITNFPHQKEVKLVVAKEILKKRKGTFTCERRKIGS